MAGIILAALFTAERSHAVYLLKKQGISRLDVLGYLAHGISKVSEDAGPDFGGESPEVGDVAEQPSRDPLKSFTINLIESAACWPDRFFDWASRGTATNDSDSLPAPQKQSDLCRRARGWKNSHR